MSLQQIVRVALFAGLFAGGALLPAQADKVPSRRTTPIPRDEEPLDAPAAAPPALARPVAAAPVAAPAPVAPDAEGFVPDSRPPVMAKVDESISAVPLVATAYGFIWLAVCGFVLYTLSRVRRLESEISDLALRIRTAK